LFKHFWYLGIILVLAAVAGWYVWKEPTRQGLDVKGGIRMTLRAKLEELNEAERRQWNQNRLNITAETVRKRIDILGVLDPGVFTKGEDQVVVELPGFTNREEAQELLKATARLEFRYLKDVVSEKNQNRRYDMEVTSDAKTGEQIVWFRDKNNPNAEVIKDGTPQYVAIIEGAPLIISGEDLERAEVQQSSMIQPVVHLVLKPEGQTKFARATSMYVREHIAIVLDNKVISAPRVNEGNLRDPIIEGNFTLKEAARFSDLLNAGALPVSLEVESVNEVEPTLGAQAWERILFAGMIGTGVVAVFMMLYYLLPGILAVLALSLYILFSLAVFKWMNVTFSLPAIAGFVLSVGMAVDANILIFERIKEELRSGKTLLASVDAGFKRAFTAIFDSNMCTIVTSGILYYYGTGPVQGFATTLALGVAISFFTAITCTRTLLYSLVGFGVHPSPNAFGLRRQWGTNIGEDMTRSEKPGFDFVGRRKIYYSISLVLIGIGLVAWLAFGGIKPGIDFAGGSELVIQSNAPIQKSASEIDQMLQANFKRNGIQFAESNKQVILHVADATEKEKLKLIETLKPLGTLMYFYSDKLRVQASASIESDIPRIKELLQQKGIQAEITSAAGGTELEAKLTKAATTPAETPKTGDTEKPAGTKLSSEVLETLQPMGYLQEVSFSSISARVQQEIIQNAIKAVVFGILFVMLYITIRFAIEGGWSGLKFGAAAIIATTHDVLVVVGSAAIFGQLLGWEVNSLFLTALLTLIGFSVHDTIVVFDRVRENLRFRAKGEPFENIVNKSILQTFARSINTSFTTLMTVVFLLIFGAVTHDLRHFYVAMIIGILTGTYSSIFNASQIIVDWEKWRIRLQEKQAGAVRAVATTSKAAPKPVPSRSQNGGSEPVSTSASTKSEDEEKKRASRAVGKPPKRKKRY
jgi:protein-export membrane protein SecD/preprotein translocase SecF subunit